MNKTISENEQKCKRFNIWITEEDIKIIKSEASKRKISASSFIKMIVFDKINGDKENEKEKKDF